MTARRWILVLVFALLAGAAIPAAAQDGGVRAIPVTGYAFRAALSPDGATLAVAEDPNIQGDQVNPLYLPIRLIDLATGEIRMLIGPADYASGISFSPDGSTLASYHGGGEIVLWDVASGQEIERLGALPGRGSLVYLDAARLAVQFPSLLPEIAVWETETGAIEHLLTPRFTGYLAYQAAVNPMPDPLAAFAPVPDGSSVVTATSRGSIVVWDTATGEPRTLLEAADDQPMFNVRWMQVLADGTTLAYQHRAEEAVIFVDLASGEERGRAPAVTRAAPGVTADGSRVAWVDQSSGDLVVWDAAQPDAPARIPLTGAPGMMMPVGRVFLTPDGAQAVVSGYMADDTEHNAVLVVDLP